MKRSTLAILAACAATTLSTLAFSPVAVLADGGAPSTTQPSEHAKKHPVFEKLERVLGQLDLTADQRSKIDSIIKDTVTKIHETRESMKGQDHKAIAEAIRPIVKDAREQIKAVLTPEQLKKLHELMGEHHKPTTQS